MERAEFEARGLEERKGKETGQKDRNEGEK